MTTLLLPELREMLAADNAAELREFCTAMHPANTVDFMEGLSLDETWRVLAYAEPPRAAEIFTYFPHETQVELIESQPRAEVARLLGEVAADDRVDVLAGVDEHVVEELLQLSSAGERHEFERLSAYPEGTAGALMTTEVARLHEYLTAREALEELARQAEHFETIYYLYIIDEDNHLKGLLSARTLVAALAKPRAHLDELMDTEIVAAHVLEDQESVAKKVARYDLLAIPVVDDNQHLVGIITHDDVIDVFREEAVEDAHRAAAVAPLEDSYLKTGLLTLGWKRGLWLTILFFGAMFTAFALRAFDAHLQTWAWLVAFIPLVISTGGNSGSQAATLVITGMTSGEIHLADWHRVMRRELAVGLLLGAFLGLNGYFIACVFGPGWREAWVIPCTVLLVVCAGTTCGSMLPLIFRRIGWDPALMSNPFVACIMDILGIVIYIGMASLLLKAK